jgi:two-component system, LytTR family, sensor histidine kinase AlgZ
VHPILARKGRLGPYLVASAPIAAALAAILARPGALSLPEAGAVAIPMTVLYAFLGLSAWYPARSLPPARGRLALLVLTHAVAAACTSAVWVFAGAGLARLLASGSLFPDLPARYAREVPALFGAGLLLYFLSVALLYLLLAFEATREAERREAALEILAREAELAALKARIQPHFLFNSLNSISALVGRDPAAARQMCVGLADFLRQSLSVGERESISVREEIALATSYLDVERVRFGKRLVVETEVSQEGGACVVPPLLLQPLVENAVVHGIATLESGGVVRLQAEKAGGRLRIVIENPFDPAAPAKPRTGLGLKIVRDRLSALYGGEALFAARRLEGRHLVVLSIPVRAGA